MSTFPPIKGLVENTLIDWEGKIAVIVFLPRCNFRCRYCHSPHLVDPPSDLEAIPVTAVVDLVRERRGWVDGVVVTGGEPLLHANLRALLTLLKSEGVGIKLDTNGTNPDALAELIDEGLIDFVAMDVKAPLDKEQYESIVEADCDVEALGRTIQSLIEGDVDYEFRTTVCSALTDADDIVEIARAVSGAKRLVLQQFRPQNCLDRYLLEVEPLMRETLQEYAALAAPYVETCFVRGDPKTSARV